MNKPLISICIPTYNRCEYLKKSLESIVSQPEFTVENFEIVISDNCSTDDTFNVVQSFSQKFQNINYHKNETNINDKNFPTVLLQANGVFRKLCNDILLFSDNSLKYLLDIVNQNINEKPMFFFTNDGNDILKTDDINKALKKISFLITWIGCVGVWDEHLNIIKEQIFSDIDTKLWQVPFQLKLANIGKNIIVVRKKMFETQIIPNKDVTYGIYKIFYVNYLNLIKRYVSPSSISQRTYGYLERDLLFRFLTFNLYKWECSNKDFNFSPEENLKKLIFHSYKRKLYFPFFIVYYTLFKFINKLNLFGLIYKIYRKLRQGI